MSIDTRRIFPLKETESKTGPILYWMSRDQRSEDNWALLKAQQEALKQKVPLLVCFILDTNFPHASLRHFDFMLRGFDSLSLELQKKNIPFFFLQGEIDKTLLSFIKKNKIATTFTDFSPLKIKKTWIKKLIPHIPCSFYEVDAHNIVPCRLASPKREFGAYTLRPKITRLLDEFLLPFPKLKKHPYCFSKAPKLFSSEKILKTLKIDINVLPLSDFPSGSKEAQKKMKAFITQKLRFYNEKKNIPYIEQTSRLSPYLHFGQLSAQRLALEVKNSNLHKNITSAFLEELIVRRELSDNFCFYTENYDSVDAFPDWAKKTLKAHRGDSRPYLYSLKDFEKAKTHDELWNAAQKEMVCTGFMHGYMRMYWAKKILEWTKSPEEALKIAIFLNDKYLLDGRDPNGYTGLAWSLGGVHDRAWGERPVFGKIRYMSNNGCKNKFDILAYIKKNSHCCN